MDKPWNKLIVALDLDDKEKIEKVVDVLGPKGVKFKIGSIAFTRFGPEFVRNFINNKGVEIFLDLKLYDIPNTMAKTASVITELGVWAFTVHLAAGREALSAVKTSVSNAARRHRRNSPLILGVTVLTSSELGMQARQEQIKKFADLAQNLGLDGIISSPLDVKKIKEIYQDKLKIITPGIRNPQEETQDQKRVATANQAFFEGADYIVVGRPIINKTDYLKAAEEIFSF